VLLIVTERGDLTADWLIRELEDRGAPFVRFNTEDYPMKVRLSWQAERATLQIRGSSHSFAEFDAVWYRRPVAPRLSVELSPPMREWATRESAEGLLGTWRTLDALWVNHPDRNRLAESKPEQLRTASRIGFEVPDTLVTNDPERVKAFLAGQAGGVVCKPLWDGRVPVGEERKLFFTSLIDESVVLLDDLGSGSPYLFQAHIPKRYDLRVTVIGQEAFAVRIESQDEDDARTDWRRGRTNALLHAPETLPDEVAERCVALCEHYGLHFGAIDLARRTDGGYSFFEINPNGQWAWLEQRTGLPLRSRLADLLFGTVAA
jgi:glutathione synthase/RimK-type ligase-like ATP-grasp enzyme